MTHSLNNFLLLFFFGSFGAKGSCGTLGSCGAIGFFEATVFFFPPFAFATFLGLG